MSETRERDASDWEVNGTKVCNLPSHALKSLLAECAKRLDANPSPGAPEVEGEREIEVETGEDDYARLGRIRIDTRDGTRPPTTVDYLWLLKLAREAIKARRLATTPQPEGALEENQELRKLLWINHGCPPTALYGDDGEMQCGRCGVDFKRWSPGEIIQGWKAARTRRALHHEGEDDG